MAGTDPFAPLTRPELGALARMMYRAFNRMIDAADADLFESEGYPVTDPRHRALFARSRAVMTAMPEVHQLHTEITGRLAAAPRTGN